MNLLIKVISCHRLHAICVLVQLVNRGKLALAMWQAANIALQNLEFKQGLG